MQGVEIRRSARARRWRLEARWGEPVRLVVPQRMTASEIERVLADKRAWIEKQRRRQVPSPRAGAPRGERGGRARSGAAARLGAGGGGGRADRRLLPADPDRSPADAVGLLLAERHALLQLAARAGAARRRSTTSSSTSSATCASRTTRGRSGRCSSSIVRTGAISAPGCASTEPSSSGSNRAVKIP